MHASEATDNNGYLWVVYSFIAFVCSNFLFGLLVPNNARKTAHHTWKWKNIANSLLHSCITGIWSLYCFWQVPEMKDDLINSYSRSAQGVTCVSVGYFIYDFLDMGIHDRKRSFDLLIHHCLVISCFGLSVCTRSYLGYSLVALLVEVNSIFLHLRQLMLLYGVLKSSKIYKVNGVLNIGTFIIFRIVTMSFMFHWLLTHRADVSTTVFSLGVFSLIVIMGMNFQLLYRIWKSDYRIRQPNPANPSREEKEVSELQSNLSYPEKLCNGDCFTGSKQDLVVSQNGNMLQHAPGKGLQKSNGKSIKHE